MKHLTKNVQATQIILQLVKKIDLNLMFSLKTECDFASF